MNLPQVLILLQSLRLLRRDAWSFGSITLWEGFRSLEVWLPNLLCRSNSWCSIVSLPQYYCSWVGLYWNSAGQFHEHENCNVSMSFVFNKIIYFWFSAVVTLKLCFEHFFFGNRVCVLYHENENLAIRLLLFQRNWVTECIYKF